MNKRVLIECTQAGEMTVRKPYLGVFEFVGGPIQKQKQKQPPPRSLVAEEGRGRMTGRVSVCER